MERVKTTFRNCNMWIRRKEYKMTCIKLQVACGGSLGCLLVKVSREPYLFKRHLDVANGRLTKLLTCEDRYFEAV